MARSLSAAAALAGSLTESVARCISRRGYAAASAATGARAVERKAPEQKSAEPSSYSSSSPPSSSAPFGSWVPDPVTGYYKPGNLRMELDPAELRAMHLSRRH